MVLSGPMAAVVASVPAAIEQALVLFDPASRPASPLVRDGYLDLLGEDDPTGGHPVQRLMLNGLLARVYERFWRPAAMQVLSGFKGPRRREERRVAVRMLSLASGDRVLDVACGPGNFTRDFAEATGDGLVVGLDASRAMLAAGARVTGAANVAYVRGDACALPFAAASFDAICCFGALHLFEPPLRALEEIVRVLAPAGRLALMTTYDPASTRGSGEGAAARKYGGMLMFPREEITGALEDRGLLAIEQRAMGNVQFVSARKPDARGFGGEAAPPGAAALS
jgi:SAM-dependent methyltransferase